MKKSDELRQQIDAELAAADKLHKAAESAGRDFTAAESLAFANHVKRAEALGDDLRVTKESEENLRAFRAMRTDINTPESCYDLPGQRASQPKVIAPKLKAFANERDAYDSGLWLRGVVFRDGEARQKLEARRGMEWLASQNESNPVDGGYLVPAPLSNAIIVSREQVGALRRLAQIYPMGSDTLQIPKRTSGVTVYYPGEEGSITESDADFGRISLTAKKRAVLTYVSNELRDDSIVPIMDLLAQEMGHALALKEDQEGIIGDGTSTYGGVQGIRPAVIAATAGIHTAATGHDTWAELDISDFAGCMSLLADKYRVPGQLSWLCSAAFKWQCLDRLAISSNGALSMVFVDGQPHEMFLGYPVVLSDRMPTSGAASTVACIFGNFPRAVALGDRGGVRVAISEHVAFTTDRLALRATTRYDINVHEAGDTSTAGAIVGLKTAS